MSVDANAAVEAETQLWALQDPVGNAFRWTVGEDAERWRAVQRGQHHDGWRPIVCHFMGRSELCDFVWSGLGQLALVAERVKNAVLLAEARGVTFFEVELQDKRGVDVPGYFGMSVTGRAGRYRWQPERVTRDDLGYSCVTGIEVDPASYDGSDVCVFEGDFTVFVTPRICTLLRGMRVTGVELVPTSKYEVILLNERSGD